MEKITPMDFIKMGLGAMIIAKEKAEELVQEALKQGQVSKEEADKFLAQLKEEAKQSTQEAQESIKKELHEALKELGLATKEDITALKRELRELKKLLEEKKA